MIIGPTESRYCVDQYCVLAKSRKGKHVLFQGQL